MPTFDLPALRQRTGWLVAGVTFLYLGQRLVRRLSPTGELRPVDGVGLLVVGLLCLAYWAWRNRTALAGCPDVGHGAASSVPFRWKPSRTTLATGALAAGAALLVWFARLLSGSSEAAAWLALFGLLGFILLGRILDGSYWHSGRRASSTLPGPIWAGLGLAAAAAVTRVLFVAPVVPDFESVAVAGSLSGLLFRLAGPDRAILVGFVGACLLPVVVWRTGIVLGWEKAGLGAAVMAILGPSLIWESSVAANSVLAPLLTAGVLWSGTRVVRTGHLSGYWRLGMWTGLAWLEGDLWSGSWLLAMVVGGLILQLIVSRDAVFGRLHRGGAWGLGLVATVMLLLLSAPEPWDPRVPAWMPLGAPPDPMALAYMWFRPHSGWMPWFLTLLTPLEGCLALVGLVLGLTHWRRQPLLAVVGIGWFGGLLLMSATPAPFTVLHHRFMAVPLMLAVPALALGLHKVGTWLDQVEGHLSEAQLLVLCGVLTAAQLPGLFFGANPIQLLVDQYRGVGPDTAPAAEDAAQLPEAAGDPLHADLEVMETVPLTALWHTGGSCTMDSLLGSPRGVVIDGRLGYVYATGVEPPRIAMLELEDGAVVRIWDDGQLPEPVDAGMAGDGRLLVLDNQREQVFALAEDDSGWEVFTKGTGHYRPRGMHVMPDGSVLVADTGHSRITLFGPDGLFVDEHTAWTGVTDLDQPSDVLVNRTGTWAVSPDLALLLNLGSNLRIGGFPRTTTMAGPHLADLPDGRLVLTDPEMSRLLMLEPDSLRFTQLEPETPLIRPVGVDVLPGDGRVLLAVADAWNCRVSLFAFDSEAPTDG
ncbi:MAG: hypothetical protein F4Y08_15570 [Caldilineaceae bacterium SB0662_bin_9]|uniref:Uncharacterized protein n=1 Tax=Caldilineaceae bacterium SB0662_bin_9 TaxID=2605258 RepID=A0A6B1DXH7_9CHLR|nr:hypothetical protein [Caldilineaceae bacterium]MYD91726.1 hypothetical protein [Caldilineaceae bacterium SB0662_bin_9]